MKPTVPWVAVAATAVFGIVGMAQERNPRSSYTPDQASRGKPTYESRCAQCHGVDLSGNVGPDLVGSRFMGMWANRPARELLEQIKTTMPPGAAGSLDDQAYAEIVAYILVSNGIPPEGQESSVASTRSVDPGAQPAPLSAFTNKQVERFTPVSDEMLWNPPPGDWLSWRRTLDAHGYSPLNHITRQNVHKLRLAWAWAMAEGMNEVTPIVHDGVMYLLNPGNILQALDAKSGELIWEYRWRVAPDAPRIIRANRNIAIYHDKIYMTTSDAAIIAVDARTGKLVWQTYKADYKKDFRHTSGPIIAGGVVVSGINGCSRSTACFVTGHDPETGKELWRTSTIALPDDPNSATWGTVPPDLRGGGDTWIAGSYDPELKLFYIGTAQAKPWMAASREMKVSDAALYTNATLALDPKTGKIVWYFQHVPGETLDLDTVFERVLIDIDDQKLLFTIGKDGILWKLDRRSGAFVAAKETTFQNAYTSIDPKTGRVTYRPDIIEAKIGDWVPHCPSNLGGHDWPSTAYSPDTKVLVIPLGQTCQELAGQKVEGSSRSLGGLSKYFEMPGADGNLGRLAAFDVRTMKQVWSHDQKSMFMTSVLTTAGGLAFVGDLDRYFKAFDLQSGKILWQVRLPFSAQGFPISFSVDRKQYIAVPTGLGLFQSITGVLNRNIYQANVNNAIYVFELIDSN